MSRIEELVKEKCPDGVEYKPLYEVTTWDKNFKGVEKNKQPKVIKYSVMLAADLFALEQAEGDVFLLSTGEQTGWTTEELAGDNISEGEVVTIPWGKSRKVVDCIKYYKGKFVTGDNRIMTSNNLNQLDNKYLYYCILSKGDVIDTFYRGAGIQHPDMYSMLNLEIPVPPIEVQQEIVCILDKFTELEAELQAELDARKKQYEYYKMKLLSFGEEVPMKELKKTCIMKSGKAISASYISELKNEVKKYACFGGNGVRGYVEFQSHKGEYPIIGRQGALCGNVNWAIGDFYATEHAVVVSSLGEYTQRFLYYLLVEMNLNQYKSQGAQPGLAVGNIEKLLAPVPTIEEQQRIVTVLDTFELLCNDKIKGLPAEIEARHKQYEYYRDKLLTFERKVV